MSLFHRHHHEWQEIQREFGMRDSLNHFWNSDYDGVIWSRGILETATCITYKCSCGKIKQTFLKGNVEKETSA